MENYNFEVGKTYEFTVLEMAENSVGAKRLRLKYGKRDTYRCKPFPFQEEELPDVVYCKITDFDPVRGFPILTQDRGKLLSQLYQPGDSAFMVKDILTDLNSATKYYQLEDHWGLRHKCYFKGDPQYNAGDVKTFEIKDINLDKGYLNINTIEYAPKAEATIEDFAHATVPAAFKPGEFGNEGQYVEHKTSIVFTPGDSQPNIDEQLPKIMKVIAAFLNADGGTLNIGVNDNGVPVGMQNDYAYLNDGEDKFNGRYKSDTDGYELKIRNAVRYYLTERANTNILFEFPKEYAGNVCRIMIKPLKRPVFFNNTFLYVRTGNQNTLLKNDSISDFIQERLDVRIKDIIDISDLQLLEPSLKLADIEAIISKYYHTQPVVIQPTQTPNITVPPVVNHQTPANDEVWNHFTYYQNGEYSIQKNPSKDSDVLTEVCVHKSEKNQRILLCYDNGLVCNVEPAKIYNSNYRGKRRKNGWNTKAKLMNVFVANTFDMLGAESLCASTGLHFYKAHNVGDLGKDVENMASKGNTVVSPNLGLVKKYFYIASAHRNVIPNLILQKKDTSTSLGISENMIQYSREINYLKKL